MPAWMSGVLGATFGLNKVAILHFAVVAVIIIALVGALSSYTVRRADVIFVIDNGTIVERGTHETLLSLNGLHSHLYEIQFRDEEPQRIQ